MNTTANNISETHVIRETIANSGRMVSGLIPMVSDETLHELSQLIRETDSATLSQCRVHSSGSVVFIGRMRHGFSIVGTYDGSAIYHKREVYGIIETCDEYRRQIAILFG